jgi:probable rRNA maturation factor
MLNCEINIKIDAPFQGSIDESWLRKAVGNVLVAQGMEQPLELGLFITDDDTMRELNRTYRGVDETTDVLAFSLCEESADFVSPPDGILHLGEIIMSHPQAKRQAEEIGHSLQQELALLAIHGMLHLLGYSDEQPEEHQKMRAMEEKVLALVFDGAEG